MQASPHRHNRRCFKSLRASRESLFARALDASPSCSSNQNISLTKGRLPEACREVGRVRCPRADLQSAPGRLGYQSPGTMTGMGGAPWTGTGEGGERPCRPRPRKPGLELSLWDGIIPLGESRGGTPTGVRAPLSARRAQARRLDLRLSAFCLPSLMREEKSKWRVVDSEEVCRVRASPLIKLRRGSRCESEIACFTSPRVRGEVE